MAGFEAPSDINDHADLVTVSGDLETAGAIEILVSPDYVNHIEVGQGSWADINNAREVVFEAIDEQGWRQVFLWRAPEDSTLAGDFNSNGTVEQADLDLVLLNWGAQGTPPPSGWIGAAPSGKIDQNELDEVLLNWGAGAATNAAPAPLQLLDDRWTAVPDRNATRRFDVNIHIDLYFGRQLPTGLCVTFEQLPV